MKSDGEPITKCPVCRYDLTGLPKDHTCPECGFPFHDSMRIWWTNRDGPADVLDWIPGEGFLAIPVLGVIGFYGRQWWAIGLFMVGAVVLFAFLVRRRRRWFVILSDIGLTRGQERGESTFYRWDQLEVPPPSLLGIGRGKAGLQLQLHHLIYEIDRHGESVVRKPITLPIDKLGHFKQNALKGEIHRRWMRAVNPDSCVFP